MRTNFELYTDAQFQAEAHRRGYLLRVPAEASAKLMWSRLEPVPDGVNFEEEALEKLRGQITTAHIQFETKGTADGKSVRTATLRTF